MKRTKVLKWMLQRLKSREFDVNKGSVGEVLAVLLQSSQENAQKLADLNGIDILLQVCFAALRLSPVLWGTNWLMDTGDENLYKSA